MYLPYFQVAYHVEDMNYKFIKIYIDDQIQVIPTILLTVGVIAFIAGIIGIMRLKKKG